MSGVLGRVGRRSRIAPAWYQLSCLFLAEGSRFTSTQIESLHTDDFVNMLFFKKTATFKTA